MASYCTTAELTTYGIRAEALRSISSEDLQAAIVAASDVIDGYLRTRYQLPLVAWGTDVRRLCAKIACHDLIMVRGFNSARAGDEQLDKMYDDAIANLRDISAAKCSPNVTDSASAAEPGVPQGGGTAQVSSYAGRGYCSSGVGRGGAFQGRDS
jgi:phage gp36-like protein